MVGMPAARVTDMHVCPLVNGLVPHVGGPILPPCAPTVLTGGLPQARVSDLCTCVGPPDVIVTGAFNVLVMGMPAARLLDTTAHGGKIVFGWPTVLIGTQGGGSGGGAGGGPVMPAVPTLPSAECQQLAQAMDDAILANHTYGENGDVPPGYRYVDPSTPEGRAELDRLGLTPEMINPPPDQSSFRAEVFRRERPPGYTIAYRGTRPTDTADWESNARQGVGMRSDHYDRALSVAALANDSGEDVSFAGHSLGGGMASAAAASTGRRATTFNAAGLSEATVGGYPENAAPVDAYYTPRDPLSGLQDNREGVLVGATVAAWALSPFAGAGVGGYLAGREMGSSPVLPRAYGTRRELPETEGFWNRMNPANIIEPHGMDAVMKAIRQQQHDAGCI